MGPKELRDLRVPVSDGMPQRSTNLGTGPYARVGVRAVLDEVTRDLEAALLGGLDQSVS